jgi:hypothetical protein
MGDRSDRRIRNFLIDREYQFRFAIQMVVVSGGLTAGLGALVYHFNREASRVVNLRAMDPTDEVARSLAAQFAANDRLLLAALVAFGVLLSAALALWQIVTTHKVAGPLYYISREMKRVRDGSLGVLHALRKGDLLQGFFTEFADMHEALRERARREATTFGQLAARADEAGQKELGDELRRMQREREASLEAD